MRGADQAVVDARDRVRGRTPFVLDERRPGMLHGHVVRSLVAHGVIRSVDCSAALRVPGVVAIVTGEDARAETGTNGLYGELVRDTPIMAFDRVRYAGEPVAAVAAVDPDAAEEAAGLVVVEIDPLPAIFTIADALAADAPLISHDGNLISEMELQRGEADHALDTADLVVEEVLSTPPVQGVPLEPHVVMAEASHEEILVHSATQTPFHIRDELAAIFELPRERVRVVVRMLGGGFGAKAYARIEPLAVVLARRTGRPVKFILSRAEEFVTVHRQSSEVHFTTGVTHDGRILAMRAECVFGSGPFVDNTPRVVRHGLYSLCGPYRVEHVDLRSRALRTNTPPCGPLRAPGTAQVQWAREAHLEGLAGRLGIDPVEFRRRNLVTSADRFTLGGPAGPIFLRELLDAVRIPAEHSEPAAPPAQHVGIGYGAVLKTTQTPSTSEAAVSVGADGEITVSTSTVEMGQGARTVIAQLAAESLGVPVERVSVTLPDTAETPRDQGTLSSRSTFSMGHVVRTAAELVRDRLLELGEESLEIDRRDLRVSAGVVAPLEMPDRGRRFEQLIRSAGLTEIREQAAYTNEPMRDDETGEVGVSTHYHQSTAGACVAVDTETGRVTVLDLRIATHAGRVVNRVLAELQLEGNAAFGIGQALMEEIVFDGGQVQNANLGDYLIPASLDFPVRLSALLTEDESGEIHGIGETALPAVIPAITNAVGAAIGARIRQIPATPERILSARRRASPVT